MSTRIAASVVAGIVLAVGLILGLSTVHVDGTGCGSAFAPAQAGVGTISDAELADYKRSMDLAMRGVPAGLAGEMAEDGGLQQRCEAAVGSRRTLALPTAGVGGLALLFLGLTSVTTVRSRVAAA